MSKAFQYDFVQTDAFQTTLTELAHNFWKKETQKRLVVPNKVTVESYPSAELLYSGSATEAASYALLPKEEFINLRVASNAEAADLALAKIDRASRDAETGSGFVPINVGQELHDYILIRDSWQGDACRGRVRSITYYVSPGTFKMSFGFGSRLAKTSMGIIPSPKFIEPVLSPEAVYETLKDLIIAAHADLALRINEVWAEIRFHEDTIDKLDKDAYYKSYTVEVVCLNYDTDLETGDGIFYPVLPREIDGMNLVEAYAVVYQASAGVTASIQIYNVTDSVDMLSTNITIDVNETKSYTAATKPVINATYDDVAAFDQLRIDCDVGETATEWAALTANVLNDKLRPTFNNQNGHKYNCTTAGTTGAAEPTWPTSGTVTDGTVVWTEDGATLQGLTIIMKFRKP